MPKERLLSLENRRKYHADEIEKLDRALKIERERTEAEEQIEKAQQRLKELDKEPQIYLPFIPKQVHFEKKPHEKAQKVEQEHFKPLESLEKKPQEKAKIVEQEYFKPNPNYEDYLNHCSTFAVEPDDAGFARWMKSAFGC